MHGQTDPAHDQYLPLSPGGACEVHLTLSVTKTDNTPSSWAINKENSDLAMGYFCPLHMLLATKVIF